MPRRDVEEWFVQVGREMSSLAEELAGGRPRVAGKRSWEPRVDLLEEPHRLIVRAEIAGVRGEDIHLHYLPDRHALVIHGVRPEPSASDGSPRAPHLLEIMYGAFQREIPLPAVSVDANAIKAHYRDGMLVVMVPKLDRFYVTRVVKVES